MPKQQISRRRLLASVPALAVVPAAGLPGSDTELLELGRKLKPLAAEITAAKAADRQHQDDFEAKLTAMGLKEETEYPDDDAYIGERLRLCNELFASDDRDRDDHNGHRDWDAIHAELFALLAEILVVEPATLAGFGVQVQAIVTAHDDLTDDGAEETRGVAAFFRNACRLTGVPIPA
jgi:hypothetical protein